MHLNHLNLPVADVAGTREFFEMYFNFKCVEVKGDHVLAVLHGENGFVLVLMSSAFNKDGHSDYPAAFHMGFLVNDQEQVKTLWHRLKNDGVVLDGEPRNMRGIFGFYFHAPGNILIEVSTLSNKD
jgi:catechol 2,3-dioxygenase-like lactoylglutathione lyase family enzyme